MWRARIRPARLRAVVLAVVAAASLAAGAYVSQTSRGIDDARAAAAPDRRPPTKPRNLRVVARTKTSITIGWGAARDDVRVTRYRVFRSGSLVKVRGPRARRHTFRGLRCGHRYTLAVSARDGAGHRSARRRITGRTRGCAAGPGLPPAPAPPPAPPSVFVATGGSDGAPCTREAPCASFDRAYRVAKPGETVEVAGGRYPSQTIHAKTGMAAPYVVFREAPGERVIVGDEGETVECLEFEGSQYVTLEGFETPYTTVGGMLHQCGVSIGRSNAHHVTLVNIDAGMIWVGADNVQVLGGDFGPGIDENTKIEFATGHEPRDILIDGAVIHDQRSYQQHPECIALWGGTRVTIRNSHLYNCGTFHIFLVANGDYTISDVLIENNTFTQPDSSVHTSNTIKVGDKGGVLRNIVLRGNRIPHDELYVLQGFGDGGTGDVHVIDNEVGEKIELGSGQNCMGVDATYQPKPGVTYECRGNRIVK